MKYLNIVAAGLALCCVSGVAQAQSVSNLGDYQALDAPFRVGVQIDLPAAGFSQAASFEQNTITDIQEFLDPAGIATVVGPVLAQVGQIQQVFDLRGATVLAGYALNSPTLTLQVVSPTGEVISRDGASCAFSFNGGGRQASYNLFDNALDNESDPTTRALLGCISRAFSRYSPVDPVAGNPGSLQASMVRSALDLTNGDSLIEQGANTAGDPWIVGASYAAGGAGRFDIDRVDARVQRSFRVLEGNRAMLKIDLPFSYARISKTKVYSGQLGIGLEVPLKAERWSLEPRVAVGAVYSGQAGSAGTIVQASLTSRYVIQGLGRGRLVVGNMVGYGQTLDPPGTGAAINPELKNIVMRNGLAYDLPLKSRIAGRSTSLRASYAFTNYMGSKLRNNTFHEATLSFGLRGREESARATRDLVRFNLSTVQAKGYHTYSAGVGFRF